MLIAPGLSLRRVTGLGVADLALPCPWCGTSRAPASNAYDTLTYGCPGCGRPWAASLRDVLALLGRARPGGHRSAPFTRRPDR